LLQIYFIRKHPKFRAEKTKNYILRIVLLIMSLNPNEFAGHPRAAPRVKRVYSTPSGTFDLGVNDHDPIQKSDGPLKNQLSFSGKTRACE
jgi:hypothetical protein